MYKQHNNNLFVIFRGTNFKNFEHKRHNFIIITYYYFTVLDNSPLKPLGSFRSINTLLDSYICLVFRYQGLCMWLCNR